MELEGSLARNTCRPWSRQRPASVPALVLQRVQTDEVPEALLREKERHNEDEGHEQSLIRWNPSAGHIQPHPSPMTSDINMALFLLEPQQTTRDSRITPCRHALLARRARRICDGSIMESTCKRNSVDAQVTGKAELNVRIAIPEHGHEDRCR